MMKRKTWLIALLLLTVQQSACNANSAFDSSDSSAVNSESSVDGSSSTGGENESNAYMVTFDAAGGSTIEPQTVLYGGKVVKPNDPTKAPDSKCEYVFVGWFFENRQWDFDKDIVWSNITLTARWQVESIYTPPFTPSD